MNITIKAIISTTRTFHYKVKDTPEAIEHAKQRVLTLLKQEGELGIAFITARRENETIDFGTQLSFDSNAKS